LSIIKASIPFGSLPPAALPGWATAGSGGYYVYAAAGNSPDAVDYTAPVGFAQAGDPVAYVFGYTFTADTQYVLALRAVSDAGVEEDNEACWTTIVIDALGNLAAGRPNALRYARSAQAAAGMISVHVVYDRVDERAAATAIQVAAMAGDEPNWSALLATEDITGLTRVETDIEVGPLPEGVAVRLAVRAVTADGLAGPYVLCLPIAPDATAPDAPASLTAEAVV